MCWAGRGPPDARVRRSLPAPNFSSPLASPPGEEAQDEGDPEKQTAEVPFHERVLRLGGGASLPRVSLLLAGEGQQLSARRVQPIPLVGVGRGLAEAGQAVDEAPCRIRWGEGRVLPLLGHRVGRL